MGVEPVAGRAARQGESLTEILSVRRIAGEPLRRWFTSNEVDLIVWFDDAGCALGFELSYDKGRGEHAIAWREGQGYTHWAVDDGEKRPGKPKGSPLLIADGPFDARRLHRTLSALREGLPPEVADYVLSLLARHPSFRPALTEPS